MMAFFTHCLRRLRPDARQLLLSVISALFLSTPLHAGASAIPVLTLERADDGLWLSTQLEFELPKGVEEALVKGIPIDFVASAELIRNRWYWTNQSVRAAQRRLRLAYQPLTGRWRLSVTTGEAGDLAQGLALSQNYASLPEALSAVRRFYRWRIGEPTDVVGSAKHWVRFRFELDVAHFLRPLQISTFGQSDWQLLLTSEQELVAEPSK